MKWIKKLRQLLVKNSAYRYKMSYDQPSQIDCRVTYCRFYKSGGHCDNVSPAITLNKNGVFVCWSQDDLRYRSNHQSNKEMPE